MSQSKEEILKSILSIRRRLTQVSLGLNREIDVFEEQMNKAFRRVDKISYLSKKFSVVELEATHRAYEELLSPSKQEEK